MSGRTPPVIVVDAGASGSDGDDLLTQRLAAHSDVRPDSHVHTGDERAVGHIAESDDRAGPRHDPPGARP